MADMREYREIIKAAVAAARAEDTNWSWRIASITKDAAEIGWGYLDYVGESTKFRVEISDDEDPIAVVGILPTGNMIYTFVGQGRWDDCRTIEEAITATIRNLAETAHSIY